MLPLCVSSVACIPRENSHRQLENMEMQEQKWEQEREGTPKTEHLKWNSGWAARNYTLE